VFDVSKKSVSEDNSTKRTNSLCFQSNKPDLEFIKSSFYRQSMAFQCTLAPSCLAILVHDLDEEPSGLDAEVLDGLDRSHSVTVN
jgi:hypothetical protein